MQPNAFVAWTDDGQYLSTNAHHDGTRCDYVESPEYIFLDGRDQAFHRMPKADGFGAVVCRSDDAEHWEFIGYDGAQGGSAVEGGNARAYNFANDTYGDITLTAIMKDKVAVPALSAEKVKVSLQPLLNQPMDLSPDAAPAWSSTGVSKDMPQSG